VENGYWPEGAEAAVTLASFMAAFATLGYAACAPEDAEPGFERVALFADDSGTPTHAA
jgi:hypothetical protein